MKKNRAFTLVEMLAVVVILGIVLMITIPAVSHNIEDSRRKTYIDIAREYIDIAANEIAKGTFPLRNSDTSYYIHINNLQLEKGRVSSPYAEWVDAYVAVTLDEDSNYTYYWISIDASGYKVDLTKEQNLRESSIVVSKEGNIKPIAIEGRTKIVVYDRTGSKVNL